MGTLISYLESQTVQKMRGFLALALLLLATAARAQEQRAFSLFNVVKFQKDECQATENEDGGSYSGLWGTCMTSTECSDKGGVKKGNCAQGFGVCCLQQKKECGGTISHNNTYIANVGYPTTLAAGANTCTYTIDRVDGNDIAQVRLDFTDLVLTAGTNGLVSTATSHVAVKGGSGANPPLITGDNTGDHMYIEVFETNPTITVTTIASQTGNKWNIRVQQIRKDSQWKAPRDCTQWFTENTGIIRSYNARGATKKELSNQNMDICIRQNEGMCGVFLTASTFQVGTITATAGVKGATCATAEGALTVSGSHGGVFCQGVFSTIDAQTSNAPVTVKNGPIRINHFTKGATATTQGFVINFSQI